MVGSCWCISLLFDLLLVGWFRVYCSLNTWLVGVLVCALLFGFDLLAVVGLDDVC